MVAENSDNEGGTIYMKQNEENDLYRNNGLEIIKYYRTICFHGLFQVKRGFLKYQYYYIFICFTTI